MSLVGVGLLAGLLSAVMYVRVSSEGLLLSGLAGLTVLLAVLVAFVMLLSAALVFFTAMRDGSPEQDDLAHYSALVQAGLVRQRAHEDRADQMRTELELLVGSPGPPDEPQADPPTDDAAAGQEAVGVLPTKRFRSDARITRSTTPRS